jgi:hypothetical protein
MRTEHCSRNWLTYDDVTALFHSLKLPTVGWRSEASLDAKRRLPKPHLGVLSRQKRANPVFIHNPHSFPVGMGAIPCGGHCQRIKSSACGAIVPLLRGGGRRSHAPGGGGTDAAQDHRPDSGLTVETQAVSIRPLKRTSLSRTRFFDVVRK